MLRDNLIKRSINAPQNPLILCDSSKKGCTGRDNGGRCGERSCAMQRGASPYTLDYCTQEFCLLYIRSKHSSHFPPRQIFPVSKNCGSSVPCPVRGLVDAGNAKVTPTFFAKNLIKTQCIIEIQRDSNTDILIALIQCDFLTLLQASVAESQNCFEPSQSINVRRCTI